MAADQLFELTASQMLKALRLGKKIATSHENWQQAVNLRNRIATLKSEEDKLLTLLPIPEDPQTLFSSIKFYKNSDGPVSKIFWLLSLHLGPKKKPKTFSVKLEDSGESSPQANAA